MRLIDSSEHVSLTVKDDQTTSGRSNYQVSARNGKHCVDLVLAEQSVSIRPDRFEGFMHLGEQPLAGCNGQFSVPGEDGPYIIVKLREQVSARHRLQLILR